MQPQDHALTDPRLASLRSQFLERISWDTEAINQLVNPADDSGILALRSLCHFLKGTAPLFGYSDLSDAAQALHGEIRRVPQNRGAVLAKWTVLSELVRAGRARLADA